MNQPPQATEPRRTAQSVRDYARNARLAIWLQFGVAAVALGAIVVFGFMIQGQTAKLAAINTELDAASSRLTSTDSATQAILQAASALATREPAQYDAAIKSLDNVRTDLGLLAADLDAQKAPEAFAQLRNVRFSVTRTLASALFTRPDRGEADLARAIDLETENLSQAGLTGEQTFSSTIALATFQCERNDAAAAKALLTPDFVAAHPNTGANGVLPDRCRTMAGIATPAVAAFDASKADPRFRIQTVLIQIVDEADRARAGSLAKSLCSAGYSVPGIEKVAASKVKAGELIYYFPEQASEAGRIAEISSDQWPSGKNIICSLGNGKPQPGCEARTATRQLTGFDNLPQHTAELWLPATGQKPPQEPGVPRCTGASQSTESAAQLVARFTSDNKADRLAAGQIVAHQIRSTDNTPIISALLGALEGPELDARIAAGRLNVLYMLNVEPDWSTRPEKQRLTDALNNLDTRAKTKGMVIGGQTRDCITQLKLKIDGKPGASDRCGGL